MEEERPFVMQGKLLMTRSIVSGAITNLTLENIRLNVCGVGLHYRFFKNEELLP
jgi:hypothetical protein